MKINLRRLYPFYTADCFYEIPDNIAEQLKLFDRREHADYERRRNHSAFYSLDVGDGIEKEVILLVLSPEEIYEQKLSIQELCSAIHNLPDKQAKRIYAHFFLGMSKAQIARIEDVTEASVKESIARGIRNIKNFLKNRY